jgi:protein gp37
MSKIASHYGLTKYFGEQRLITDELKTEMHNLEISRTINLPFTPEDKAVIFVCSGNDMFTKYTPTEATKATLLKCNEAPENYYLFQTKNPIMFLQYKDLYPPNTILGITVETDNDELVKPITNAPLPTERLYDFEKVQHGNIKAYYMISIEPKMKCNPERFTDLLKRLHLDFVSIGADSGNNHLPESSASEVYRLLDLLKEFTFVISKKNLNRLLNK